MTRLSVSRPTWSVPRRLCASGGLFMRRKSALSGSRGASSGAAIAVMRIKRPTSPPIADSVLRRENRPSSTARAFMPVSAVPDARVEPRVAEIDQDVDADEDHRVEQHEILHDDDVALDHRGDERTPEAGHAEGLLHRDRAAEDEAEQHAGDRDDRQERVGQRVAHHHEPLAEPLRTGRPYEVLADDLEQTRARHPRDVGALRQPEDHGRADDDLQVLPWILPEVNDDDRRLVAEPEQESEHDQHAEPEARDRDEQDRDRAGEAVRHAVRPERAQDANREPDEPGDDQREHADLGADRAPMEDLLGDGIAPEERLAEATRRDVTEPADVLQGQRVAEPQVGHDARAIVRLHLRVAFGAEDGHERIPRQDPQNDEDAERDAEQSDGGVQRPARQVLPHALGTDAQLSQTVSHRTTS